MTIPHDITGQRFGRLTALRFDRRVSANTYWVFRCDCGTEKSISMTKARSGHTSSCGCLRREMHAKSRLKHGYTGSRNADGTRGLNHRLYGIWSKMKWRCTSPKCQNFERYGGRGIYVCDEWSASFEAFCEWSLANGYRPDLTIDRINNDGPYSPDNCRWADRHTQALNRAPKRWPRKPGIERELERKRA